VVYRSQIDFNELKSNLVRLHPGCIVPPLPKKPVAKLEKQFIDIRRKELQIFLNKLLEHPLLSLSILVENFLNIANETDYKSIKANEGKIIAPTQVSEFTTLNGKASIRYTTQLERACHNIHTSSKQIRDEFYK